MPLESAAESLHAAAEVRADDVSVTLAWLRVVAPDLAELLEAVAYEPEHIDPAAAVGLLVAGNRYLYLVQRGIYYDARRAQPVTPQAVRGMLDRLLEREARTARLETLALRTSQRRALLAWEMAMRQRIKQTALTAAAGARGGVARMHLAALVDTQARVAAQYTYLSAFAQQIEGGAQPVDGRAGARAGMYVEAARGVYMEGRDEVARGVGYTQRQNIRYEGDSCDGCVAMEALGWVDLDDARWIPIGNRDCMTHCRCGVDYRVYAGGAAQRTRNPELEPV